MERHDLNLSYKKRRLDSTTNPKGEGGSTVVQSDSAVAKFLDNVVYRLYIKGLVSEETVVDGKEKTKKAGFGVAICDEKDNLLYEIKESLGDTEISCLEVESKALIRGLRESLDFGIRNVMVYCDDQQIYQYIIGGGKVKKKIVHLVDEFQLLLEDMTSHDVDLVAPNDVNFAFRLAREAIVSRDDVKAEICGICVEETDAERMLFTTDQCLHRHCFICVKQHVEVKLLSGTVPTCLDDECTFKLTLESCGKVLTPKLIEMWKQKMKEDSIPAAERIYCPYPNCSMLMSKTELSSEADQSNVRSCVKCCGLFCIDCKVPSHTDLSCDDYKKLHPDPLVDDLKLKSLAKEKEWRHCAKCRHLIELSHGCNHMTCICGYEFCYQCGIEWKKNQRTCPSAGCLQTGHGDYDDDDPEYDYEEDTGNYYSDEEGRRWPCLEEYSKWHFQDYNVQMDDQDVEYKYQSPEQFFSEDENTDGSGDNGED
ncbi:unnamed protein product [Arabidopsis halleri]